MLIEKGKYYKRSFSNGDHYITIYANANGREDGTFSGKVVLSNSICWHEGDYRDAFTSNVYEESVMSELVEEAIKRFPLGYRYQGVNSVGNLSNVYIIQRIPRKYRLTVANEYGIEAGKGYLLYKGNWARPEKLDMDNTVIKVLNKEHGKKVIEYFRSIGIRTSMYEGTCTEKNDNAHYYGLINDEFRNYSKSDVLAYGVKIIELPEEEFDMTTDEGRLAYAKKHYPVGTKYTPIDSYGQSFRKSAVSEYEVKEWELHNNSGITGLKVGDGLIYTSRTNTWAEIIKEDNTDESIVDGVKLEVGKSYSIKYKHSKGSTWKLVTINRITQMGHAWSDDNGGIITDGNYWVIPVGEDQLKEKVMGKQKLSRQGLKEIHEVACPNWKDVLEHYGSRNPLENYIELTQEEVNKMFIACTSSQLPIVSKYLKHDDDGSVDLSDFVLTDSSILQIRIEENYKNKSFFLSNDYDWEIKKDDLEHLCLIPTKKK